MVNEFHVVYDDPPAPFYRMLRGMQATYKGSGGGSCTS